MIRKMRRKFVFTNMLLLTAMLLVVLFSTYSSSAQTVRQNSIDVLERVIDREYPGWPTRPGAAEVSLPYFTVQIDPNSIIYLTASTYSELEDSNTLIEIVSLALADGGNSGLVPGYNLRYLRQNDAFFTRIAFVDITAESHTLRDMVVGFVQIGLISLVLLFALSCLLAWWAVRPAEQALRRQQEFIANASHELKTPLTVILSNADLIRGAEAGDERSERWIEGIQSEGLRMKALVEEMLLLERADSMAPNAPHTTVEFSDVAEESALLFEAVAYEKNKPLQYEVEPGIRLWGDREKLHRLLSILLDNAVKYGAEGQPITLTCRRAEKKAVLTVENQGDPIPPQELRRIFHRFYRSDKSRGETGGFGLGLAIAETIVQEHKGTLRAESDQRSTRFILTLPIQRKEK